MRVLLSNDSKKIFFNLLKRKYNCKSLRQLSFDIGIPFNTLNEWAYNPRRYIPENIIPEDFKNKLKILNKEEDNWGRVKGGQKTYQIIIKKYGPEELKKRRINGGRKSICINNLKRKEEVLKIDISDPLFLEFYGALLGDGWLSKLRYREKNIYILGVSGNKTLDADYFLYLKKILKKLIGRNVYIKERPKFNSIEIYFAHKAFVNFLHDKLNFPVGKKINLEINDKVFSQGFEKVKYVIRGIFDTDGCFLLDKTPAGYPYPVICITMKAPILMNQIRETLKKNGFKPQHYIRETHAEEIRLKGSRQLEKWMKSIGSSNNRNLDKIARVTQLDRVPHS